MLILDLPTSVRPPSVRLRRIREPGTGEPVPRRTQEAQEQNEAQGKEGK